MEIEQIREIGELEHTMYAKLRGHSFVGHGIGMHVFQYLILPSFTPLIAWDVFAKTSRKETIYTLIRTCWRKDSEYERLRSPIERLRHPYPLNPTMELHEIDFDPEELRSMEQELRSLQLPIAAQPRIGGVDGTFYELAIGQPDFGHPIAPSCRIAWWHHVPPNWLPLRAWVERVHTAFESAWKTPGKATPITEQFLVEDTPATTERALVSFREGHFGRAAELFTRIESRRQLTPAEVKMREIALRRTRDGATS